MHSTTSQQLDSVAVSPAWNAWNSVSAALSEEFQGLWIEIMTTIMVVIMFIWHSKSSALWHSKSNPFSSKIFKVAGGGGKRQTRVGSKVEKDQGDDAQRIKKFVTSLLMKSSKNNPSSVLEGYEELVQSCGASLRRHISDDQNARSMYLHLINSAVCLATPARQESGAPDGTATWSWTSRLLADMKTFGFPCNADFYGAALKMFGNAQLFQEGLTLHDFMVVAGVLPSNSMLIMLLNMAGTCGEYTKALSFFDRICETPQPAVRTIMTVLRVHVATNDWQGSVKLLDRMVSLGTQPDNLILNGVLGLCVSCLEIDAAQLLLTRWKDITDVVSWNILLKGCAQLNDLKRAEVILQSMSVSGPAPNLISYNTTLDCAVRSMRAGGAEGPSKKSSNQWRNAAGAQGNPNAKAFAAVAKRSWDLIDQLTAQGLEPDRYTCSTLVKGMHLTGCCPSDIDRAVDLLNRVGADALQAGRDGAPAYNERLMEVLFNTLLDACITVHDLDRMSKIFDMMQQFGVKVSAVTYGTLIKAFGQSGAVKRCRQAWEDMRRSKIEPTIVTYGCYIDACIRNEDTEHAEEIFESMETSGVRPNAVIYTSLIRGFAHAKQPHKALEIYRRMQREGVEANSVTFNSILDIVGRQLADISVLHEVMNDMCKAGVVPDAVTYSILIKASCSGGNIQNALSLFRQFQSNGLVFDQVAFNTLLLSCSKAEQVADAEDIFNEMRRLGMTPTHVTCSIMVKMYGRAKMLDKAIAVSEIVEKEYGQKPNLYVYTSLIQACAQNKQVRKSWDIFNQMIQAGVEPDAITYGTVIHGCVYLNKFSYAMSLVRHAYTLPWRESAEGDFALPALKHEVPLQRDVLQMLVTALRRKDQSALAAELDDIMASRAVAPSADKSSGGNRTKRADTHRPTRW